MERMCIVNKTSHRTQLSSQCAAIDRAAVPPVQGADLSVFVRSCPTTVLARAARQREMLFAPSKIKPVKFSILYFKFKAKSGIQTRSHGE